MSITNTKKGIGMALVSLSLISAALTGCGAQKSEPSPAESGSKAAATPVVEKKKENVTLSVGIFAEDLDFWQKKSQEEAFKKALPNVTLDIQSYKDSGELLKALKVRQAAGEMPDVFYMKPDHVLQLKDSLYVWGADEPLVKMNKAVNALEVNKAGEGKYYGLPMKQFAEWVYYRKSVFSELGLQVPQTWDEFVNTAKAIQDSGKYQGLALGGKDSWPQYPFVGFGPFTFFNDDNTNSKAAKTDTPFSPEGHYYKAFEMVEKLYKSGATGKALGIGYSEAGQMFASKKAGMMTIGQYYYPDYVKNGGDIQDLGIFPLPVVNDKNETNRQVIVVDLPFGISKNSKHIDEAKKVLEWYFSPDVYKSFLTQTTMSSTINGIDADNLFTMTAKTLKVTPFYIKDGDENFVKLMNETKWDGSVIGQQMLTGKDFRPLFEDLNKKWTAARQKLGIK